MTFLAAIYNSRHDYNNAGQILTQALIFSRPRFFWNNYSIAESIYKELHKLYAGKNDVRLANLYADSAFMASDSISAANNTQVLAQAHDKIEHTQHRLASDKMQNEIKNAAMEISYDRKISMALGLSSIIFLVLGVLVVIKNKQIAAEKKNADRQRQRAENSEKFKQQFLANMSHEIRTPMNAVIGMTDIILEKKPRKDQVGFLKAISKSSDILLHIINDILDLSKIEAGKMELESIDFSLADTLKQVVSTLSWRAEEKGLQITTEIDGDVPDIIVGDPYRLNQILINLGGNAIKFTERGGVTINIKKIKQEEGHITIQCSVTDTGVGIPSEKRKDLFADFSQVSSSDTRKYGGTGLGLSISKQLVTLHGGTISVDSTPGVGSTFSFIITYPVGSAERLQQRIAEETKADGSILDGLNILLADDNEYNRMVVNETLHLKADVHTDVVVNGEEAVRMVEGHNYDVVLMDVQMPVMNGVEATAWIRQNLPAPKNQVPIIAFTASILRSDIEKFMNCGMNSWLPKPFKAWQLVNTIAEVTGRKKAQSQEGNAAHRAEVELPETEDASVSSMRYLEKFCDNDKDRMKKYVLLYLKGAPIFKKNLADAASAKDFVAVSQQIHAFKPNWMMMGMKSTREIGTKIEHLCHEQNETAFTNVQVLLEHTDKSVEELSGVD
jgi:signal transduction histidine kinase/DNA-binding NarL/FixJ family response regulator